MMRKMKDSGVEWIGEIPEDWDVSRNRDLFIEINERAGDIESNLLSVSEYFGVKPRKDVISEDEILVRANSLENYKKCDIDDLVVNIMLAWKKGLGVSNFKGIVSPSYCVYRKRFNNICMKYYHYLFRTDISATHFKQYSTGIIDSRLRLYPDVFFSLHSPVPPFAKQQQIASFLDTKSSLIDSTIQKEREVIDKLKEYRQAVITEAVTKGIRAGIPMKDSGVEWIGEIPEGWTTYRIKYNTYLKGRIGWQGLKSSEFIDEGPYLVTGTDFKNGRVNWNTAYHISLDRYNEAPEIQLKVGDLLITKDGTVGKLAFIDCLPDKASLNSHLVVLRSTTKKYTNKYLYWVLSSDVFTIYTELKQDGSIMASLSQEKLNNFTFSLPPLSEQQDIVDYLDAKCSAIDATIQKRELAIEKLTAYKQSLIYECVTGKKEVLA